MRGLYSVPFPGVPSSTLRSPDNEALQLGNPGADPVVPSVKRSRGFEAMGRVGDMLYPMLEVRALWGPCAAE